MLVLRPSMADSSIRYSWRVEWIPRKGARSGGTVNKASTAAVVRLIVAFQWLGWAGGTSTCIWSGPNQQVRATADCKSASFDFVPWGDILGLEWAE
jgi:hypothetical protein